MVARENKKKQKIEIEEIFSATNSIVVSVKRRRAARRLCQTNSIVDDAPIMKKQRHRSSYSAFGSSDTRLMDPEKKGTWGLKGRGNLTMFKLGRKFKADILISIRMKTPNFLISCDRLYKSIESLKNINIYLHNK